MTDQPINPDTVDPEIVNPETATDVFGSLYDAAPATDPDPRFARVLRERVAQAVSAEIGISGMAPGFDHLRSAVDAVRSAVTGIPDDFPLDRANIIQVITRALAEPPVEPRAEDRPVRQVFVSVPEVAVDTLVQTVTPYLVVDDGPAALGWYERAFEANTVLRVESPSGHLGHAEFRIGGARFYLAEPHDGGSSPRSLGGSAVTIHLEVDSVDAVHRNLTVAGATSERPPTDQVHGHRTAVVVDPFGHRWMLSEETERLTVAEYAARETEWRVHGSDDDRPSEPSRPAW